MRILLACPDRDLLRSLTGVLEADGHTVTAVFDAPQALTAAERVPDLLVLDPAVPGTEPGKLTQRFREKGIPILLLSDRPVTAALLREVAAESVLEYPFTPAELTARVGEMEAEAGRPEAFFGPDAVEAGGFRMEGIPLMLEEARLLRALEGGAGAPDGRSRIYVKTLNEKLEKLRKKARIGFEAEKGYRWEVKV